MIRPLLPGISVCAAGAVLSLLLAQVLPGMSPLLLAILLGTLLANLFPLTPALAPGIGFTSKKLLRIGIALLGFQLVIMDILGLGWGLFVVVVSVVGLGLAGTVALGRLLGLSPAQRLLIACGFSICGAAAVAAADGVVEAEEEEVLTAIALVVIFGTLMIPAVPRVSNRPGTVGDQIGHLGRRIHS